MRKHLTAVILALLLAAALCAVSAAAGEGDAVQAGPFSVTRSGEHCALLYTDSENRTHSYMAAVYQPEDSRAEPELEWNGQYLKLSYGDTESYTFCECEEGSGEFQLADARVNDFYVAGVSWSGGYSWHYQAADSGFSEGMVLPEKITLSNFNIRLFPRSEAEARHLNYMRARFESGLNLPGAGAASGEMYDADHPGESLRKPDREVPVYSAPYGNAAWRAGNGTAAAGPDSEAWLLSQYKNEAGESYACVRCDAGGGTQRIGYALCKDLGLPEITEQVTDPGHTFVRVPVEAAADTFLTDDPDAGQSRQFEVPKGTRLVCLGLYNNDYAYAAAEAKDGRLAEDGAAVWGFVPVRDLQPVETERPADIAEALAGDWMLEAGGSLAEDVLHFRADGTFTTENGFEDVVQNGADSGTWYVTEYDPAMNLYWNQPLYELTLLYDNGRATVLGLTVTTDGFGLSFWEGGAGYIPYEEMPWEPMEFGDDTHG